MATPKSIGSGEIHAAIDRLAVAISERHAPDQRLLLLGIANGGVELARRIALRLSTPSKFKPAKSASKAKRGKTSPPMSAAAYSQVVCGVLDISFHRDDIGRHPIPKEFAPTHIPADVHGAMIILFDDVLFSGRTVKAALEELFDHGRPTKVELAVLIDRGGRLLPVAADYVGMDLIAEPSERVTVTLDPAYPDRDAVALLPQSKTATRKSKIS